MHVDTTNLQKEEMPTRLQWPLAAVKGFHSSSTKYEYGLNQEEEEEEEDGSLEWQHKPPEQERNRQLRQRRNYMSANQMFGSNRLFRVNLLQQGKEYNSLFVSS